MKHKEIRKKGEDKKNIVRKDAQEIGPPLREGLLCNVWSSLAIYQKDIFA